MDATERARAVVHHEVPDRCPVFLMDVYHYSRALHELHAREAELLAPWRAAGGPTIEAPLSAFAGPARVYDYTVRYFLGQELERARVPLRTGFEPLVLDAEGAPVHDPVQREALWAEPEGRYVNYFGLLNGWTTLASGDRYTWYAGAYLQTKDDYIAWFDEHGWPHEHPADDRVIRAAKEFQRRHGDKIFVMPEMTNGRLYEETWPAMGQARWTYYCRKDPAFIHRVINSHRQAQVNLYARIRDIYGRPPVVFAADDYGQKGRALFSPAWFRKFLAGPLHDIWARVHADGGKVIMHSCGNIVELLPDLIRAGLDGWQALEVPAGIDHAAVKRKFGDQLVLVGGIDSSRELAFGTPASVERHVKHQLRAMAPGGGYIPGPAHDFVDAPLDNVLAMRDALYRWGTYPLRWDE